MFTARIGELSQARIVLVGGAWQMSKPSPWTTARASETVGPGGGAAPACGAITTAPEARSASAATRVGRTPRKRVTPASRRALLTDVAEAAGRERPSPLRTSASPHGR